ncbi:hypothetical protein EI546_09765 [Aequorivita sp. H23M31]|uniref:Blue (type 1) copper domain-containing protein n=1 Tax=Aequorivita ciconiae TaxID=2494375 RepID=A0A410G422_9FLAO|nr:plastocyanin/azurin family copper-binding protein [Aequorivita sp. H23M31]QAA81991.1 hypothetical protein EI546_09765 [Aequorivita sp. H23M31]
MILDLSFMTSGIGKYVILIFLVVSCNSNKKSETPAISNEDAQNTHMDTVASENVKRELHIGKDTIVIIGMEFHPKELHLKKGATVVWINKDIVPHDASEFPNKNWTSGPLAPGESWKMKVDKSYDYFCSIHITMKGKLFVDP